MSDTSLAAMAVRLITKRGRTVTLRKFGTTIPDPDRPHGAKTGADTTVTPKAAVLAYKNEKIDGELILRGDKMAYVAVDGVNDFATFASFEESASDIWTIVAADIVKPGDTEIVWILQLRR